MAISSANGLVGTGSLQPRAGFKGPVGRCKATTPSSFAGLILTTNLLS